MASVQYEHLERALVEALPEIQPAADRYWAAEGRPGSDAGPSVFYEDMFGPFLELLLGAHRSPRRDELARRSFEFVEGLVASDDVEVANLGSSVCVNRPVWWFVRAREFMGVRTTKQLNLHWPDWRHYANSAVEPTEGELRDVIDLYGVRQIIGLQIELGNREMT